jgi:DNA ligase-1
MADLQDGESIEMQGSGSRPYVLKNVGGVYSCNCPAWRNQSVAIERRTCKHLRKLRGDAAEQERIGGDLPASAAKTGSKVDVMAPPLLLAESWDGQANLAGWWMSEKLDGVRAYWTGQEFLSRLGNRLHAPEWFTAGLPTEPLDGEFWIARKGFQRTVSIVRRQDKTDLWNEVRFLIFDAPGAGTAFEGRLRAIESILQKNRPPFARALDQSLCNGTDHLRSELARIESLGGEGLMLRQPESLYATGRSPTLLKVKSFVDSEARVVGHEPGKGRHKGRLGALLVELPNGKRFAVGTGLSDAERSNPPSSGSTITFRYQELTDGGVPRFPSYVGVRASGPPPIVTNALTQGEANMATKTVSKRRFEFVGGGSDKFWEISVSGKDVTVRFGRNGTNGQSSVKTLSDSAAAEKHAEKLINEKLGKGYTQTV